MISQLTRDRLRKQALELSVSNKKAVEKEKTEEVAEKKAGNGTSASPKAKR